MWHVEHVELTTTLSSTHERLRVLSEGFAKTDQDGLQVKTATQMLLGLSAALRPRGCGDDRFNVFAGELPKPRHG